MMKKRTNIEKKADRDKWHVIIEFENDVEI